MITATFGLWGSVVGGDISNIIEKICDKIAVLSFQAYFVHMIFLWVCTRVSVRGVTLFDVKPIWVATVAVTCFVYALSLLTSYFIDQTMEIMEKALHRRTK